MTVAATNQAWTYDSFGNRTSQTSSNPNMPTSWAAYNSTDNYNGTNNRISTSSQAPGGVAYDLAGRLLSDGINHYLWEAQGKLCGVTTATNSYYQYIYDAEGNLVTTASRGNAGCNLSVSTLADFVVGQGGQKTTTVNGSHAWQSTNVYANGELLATYDNAGLHFALNDWLGTKRIQASPSGATELTCWNLPFNDASGCSGPGSDATDLHYTGKEHDPYTGLDLFGARQFTNYSGRFLSPDFSGADGDLEPVPYADLKNPQSLNLYSYTQNNPLSHTDPDGHECIINADGSMKDGTLGGQSCADVVHDNAVNPFVSVTVKPMDEGQVNPGDLGMGLYAGAGIGRIAGGAALSGLGVLARGLGTIGTDSVEASLTSAAEDAANAVGEGKGPVYGTRVHSAFENNVNAMGNSNLATEVSYKNGVVVPRGTPGSVRLDVVEGQLNAPSAVYDLKTGGAQLTAGRIQQIQSNIPGGSTVPVIQIKP